MLSLRISASISPFHDYRLECYWFSAGPYVFLEQPIDLEDKVESRACIVFSELHLESDDYIQCGTCRVGNVSARERERANEMCTKAEMNAR